MGDRMVIFSGGSLGEWALEEIRDQDILVGADRGALFLIQHGFRPHYALGDFDSVNEEELALIRSGSLRFEACDPVAKNYTDTEMAFNWALQQQPCEIVLMGGLGTRFDHSLSNIHLLAKGLRQRIQCKMIDEHNEISLIDESITLAKGKYTYVSLLPMTMEVTGITLQGFQYPLNDAVLTLGESLAVSNQLADSIGTVRITSGLLLVIQSMD